jgi:uncharacterized protein (DUF1015 family)
VPELRPFRALRPHPEFAAAVAAPPYDVVDVTEARALAAGNLMSFLHVTRPEIDLPDGAAAASVHAAGRAALAALVQRGVLSRDAVPTLSVYAQRRGTTRQTGVVGLATVADYRAGAIAIHEHTRPDKEDDRTAHLQAVGAHDEPVFLMYPEQREIETIVDAVTGTPPTVQFTDRDQVEHLLWVVDDPGTVSELGRAFGRVPVLYVADGHHRSAAAARLHDLRGGDDGSDAFPVVAFPAERLTVLPYHRVVTELGVDRHELVDALADRFTVTACEGAPELDRHRFGLYSGGQWYLIDARPGTVDESDPIARLDVAVLQATVLEPLLGIIDPRTDGRLGFVGGSRGLEELERLVDSGRYAAAFALHPTSPTEVMAVADQGLVMPPKSTWFDPKLASGLFVHPLDAG